MAEDLKVDIGTKERVVWEKTLTEAKALLEQSKENMMIQEGIIELAEKKIADEKAKMKK